MVVELLTFEIEPEIREAWMDLEERVWSRFLERQPGFVRKELWVSDDAPSEVHAVIWWESMEQWKSITPEQVAEVDERMGDLVREPTCRAMQVLREC